MRPTASDQLPRFPDDLPVNERTAVRLVVLDAHGDVLLLRAGDRSAPEHPQWWELPGGGLDEGESYAAAAVRELREETGIDVPVAEVGRPTWRRSATFKYRGRRHLQHEVVALVRVAAVAPEPDGSGREQFELEDYSTHWWAAPADVAASAERFYPGRLPSLLLPFLAGETIDEPFEVFS